MSHTPKHPGSRAEPRIDRLRPWIAAGLSVLLHVLLILILILIASRPPVVTAPHGASAGGRMKVDFVGESAAPEQRIPIKPNPRPQKTPKPVAKAVARQRADPRKPVMEAKFIEPPAEAEPESRDSPEPAADSQASSAASPPSTVERRPQTWTGRPPGMLERDVDDDDGRARGPANLRGNQADMVAGEPAMEVGGYQVVYDLIGDLRLQTWMANGMTELSIPLPGTRYLMVCPAEVALRRESSKCRLVEPEDPQLKSIGDARQVISVMNVYHRGEMVWKGPGPYR
ncbi:MAG: hypothetical protein J7507_08185 [Pseudoxanthomonas sp.]|nr:hypothetical protein [Pseudoxanthomonas sp.]